MEKEPKLSYNGIITIKICTPDHKLQMKITLLTWYNHSLNFKKNFFDHVIKLVGSELPNQGSNPCPRQ